MSESPPTANNSNWIMDRFSSLAIQYDDLCQDLGYPGPQLTSKLLEECPLPDSEKCLALDLGCGTGLIASTLRTRCYQLDGVDLTNPMLQIARQRKVYDHLYLQENTSLLQSTDVAYHLIVAISVFQFQGQLAEVLRAALKRLVPEGWLLFTVAAGPLLGDGFQWQAEGYFCHSPRYVMQILGELGISGGKMLRVPWSCPCPFTEHALVFSVQRPMEPDRSDP